MKVVIDRFEGDFAVCEIDIGDMINIEKSKLPSEAKEGYILHVKGDVVNIDKSSTLNQKKKIDNLMKDLWE